MRNFICRLFGSGAVFALLWVVGAAGAEAQQGTIAGVVTDQSSGTPVAGARVLLGGTNRSAVTNQEGRYTITAVVAGTYEVRVSVIGYAALAQPATVAEGAVATLDFALRPAAVSLDALVVTATGEQRAREMANVVASIKASDIVATAPVTDFASLLNGRTANVQVLPASGTAGTGARVRIRGLNSISLNNEPIYYVDGVRVESSNTGNAALSVGTGGQSISRVNDLNPEEIESIEIVKGPSAATLYGTQAANGVIRITTKKGLAGRTRWTVYSEFGVSNDRNTYPTNYFSWGRSATTNALQQCLLQAAAARTCVVDSLTSFNVLQNDETSFFGTGYRGQVGLQASGGSDQVRYFVSGEFENDLGHYRLPDGEYSRIQTERLLAPGVDLPYEQFRPNEVQKVNLRSNLDASLNRNLDVSLHAGLVRSDGRLPQNDNNVTGMLPSGLFGKGFQGTVAGIGSDWGFFRPGDVFAILTDQDITRFTGSLNATWRPTSWLTTRATVGLDYTSRLDIQFQRLDEGAAFSTFRRGRRTDNRFSIGQYTVDVNGTGSFQLTPAITSKTSLGVQFLHENSFANFANGLELPPGGQTVGAGAIRTGGEATAETITLGAYIEQVFGWKDRRFLTAALRSDDNSAFGKDFDVVYYPKVQGSWVVSEEPFFPASFLDNLRLRVAYGASGQQPGTTDAIRFFSATTSTINGTDTPSLIIGALGNPTLKPERSTELEVGFDAGFLGERANLEVTYYNKKTKDALIERRLAPSIGASTSRFENIGSVQNRGLEAVLTVTASPRPGVEMDLTLSGSRNSSKLVKLGVPPIVQGAIRQVEGYPLYGWWQRPILGYNDLNGDGLLESNEVFVGDTAVFMGYSIPRTELALNLGLTLFDNRVRVGGLLDYRGDYLQRNLTDWFRCTSGAANNCRAINDPSTPLWDQARAVAGRTAAFGATEHGYIEDATFVKLRELSVTYHAPETWARAVRASRLSFTATGRNLATWTEYTGIDPELNGNGQNDVPIDFLTQPLLTSWAFRVNLSF